MQAVFIGLDFIHQGDSEALRKLSENGPGGGLVTYEHTKENGWSTSSTSPNEWTMRTTCVEKLDPRTSEEQVLKTGQG